VILDVQRIDVPIRGTITLADGIKRQFHGWLELADTLESARAGTLTPEPVAALEPHTIAPDPAAPAVERCAPAAHQCSRLFERRR
jgi:hypothetical protein